MVISWWNSFQLGPDIGNSWKFKLQFFRKKLRGWNSNIQGAIRRQKQSLLVDIASFESLHESNPLTPTALNQWKDCQTSLYKVYHDEELYWQQRAKLKWFI